MKARRVCSGYRDEDDLSFRHETDLTRKRVQDGWRERRNKDPTERRIHSRALDRANAPITLSCLTMPISHEALAYLFANLCSRKPAPSFNFHLPILYARSRADSPLTMATNAVALSLFSGLRDRKHLFLLAQETYVKALIALQRALGDSVEALCDETLASVLLLAQYENFSIGAAPSWDNHIDGAETLVKMRGEKQLRTQIGRALSSATNQRMV